MRPLARLSVPRFRGSAHALRSVPTRFTLVEPFPNGKLYFKPVVDRPVCVYVLDGTLVVLASAPQAFAMIPLGGRRFHLTRAGRFFSPGDYLDDETCLPTSEWSEASAWEAFRLADPPELDGRERAAIAAVDRLAGRPDAADGGDAVETAVRGCLASLAAAQASVRTASPAAVTNADPAEIGPRFAGSVDLSRRSRAAGWAARGKEATTVSVFVNGTRVGEAHGTGERPDVIAAGFARHSAWSFDFEPPLGPDDRAAFRFPDGSPVRIAAGAHVPYLGSAHTLVSAFNGFVLCDDAGEGLRFKRHAKRPVYVYVLKNMLFVLKAELSAFLIEVSDGDAVRLKRAETDRFFSLGYFLDDDTCVSETNRTTALSWERFRLGAQASLDAQEHERVESIDQAILRKDTDQTKGLDVSPDAGVGRALQSLSPRSKETFAPPVRAAESPEKVGLCAIARNEAPYLCEWVAYHLAVGFDQIFLYNNESTDGGFDRLAEVGLTSPEVMVEWWPSTNGSAQASAYDHFYKTSARSFDWVMILDIDEFLVLKRDSDIKDFLRRFYDADGVAINWRIFGSSGLQGRTPKMVLERFSQASLVDFGPNSHIKTLFRPEAVVDVSTHSPYFLTGAVFMDQSRRYLVPTEANTLIIDTNYENAQINHYFTKSFAEFEIKRARGKADHDLGHPQKYRSAEEFSIYDRNEEEDLIVLQTRAFLVTKARLDAFQAALLSADAAPNVGFATEIRRDISEETSKTRGLPGHSLVFNTSIVACARWECESIVEWIQYHTYIGFDHFFIYCNDDNPEALYATLRPLMIANKDLITFRHFPYQGQQAFMYMHFFESFAACTEWALFLDVDEFLNLRGASISDYLRTHAATSDAICFNWLMFGTNFYTSRPAGSVLKNYTRRASNVHPYTKTIVRTARIDPVALRRDSPHGFWHAWSLGARPLLRSPENPTGLIETNVIGTDMTAYYRDFPLEANLHVERDGGAIVREAVIHHYFLKSVDDLTRRVSRGTLGSFLSQTAWQELAESPGLHAFLNEINAIEDRSLANFADHLDKVPVQDYVVAPPPGRNIALDKETSQSSLALGSIGKTVAEESQRALAGCPSTSHAFETAREVDPWWGIDLGGVTRILQVRVFNRIDSLAHRARARTLRVLLSLDEMTWTDVAVPPNENGFGGFDGFPLIVDFTPVRSARFLRLQLLGLQTLHLQKVEVYA